MFWRNNREETSVAGRDLMSGYFLLEGRLRRILTGMKRWYLYLITVPLGLVILVYLVGLNFSINFADMWSRDHQAKNTQRDVGTMPDAKAVPKDVLELRQKHQLRPLTEREDGTKIQDLPNGIYGFSMCSVVALQREAWQHILVGDS